MLPLLLDRAQLLRQALRQLRRNPEFHRLLPGHLFPRDLYTFRAILLIGPRLLLHLERLERWAHLDLLERRQVQRRVVRKDKDIQRDRERRQLAGSLVRARHKAIVHPQLRDKHVPADRHAQVAHRVLVADLPEDFRRAQAAVANEADVPGSKDQLADSAPALQAEQEFRKPSRANLYMHANRPHRAAVHLSRNDTQKASANSILFAHEQVWALDVLHRRNPSHQFNANRGK